MAEAISTVYEERDDIERERGFNDCDCFQFQDAIKFFVDTLYSLG